MSTPGICRNCGWKNPPDSMFCSMCGSRLEPIPPAPARITVDPEYLQSIVLLLIHKKDELEKFIQEMSRLLEEIAAQLDGEMHIQALTMAQDLQTSAQLRHFRHDLNQFIFQINRLIAIYQKTDHAAADLSPYGSLLSDEPENEAAVRSPLPFPPPLELGNEYHNVQIEFAPSRSVSSPSRGPAAVPAPPPVMASAAPDRPSGMPEPTASRRSFLSSLFGGKGAKKQGSSASSSSAAKPKPCTVDQVYFSALTDALVEPGNYYTLRLFMGKEEHRQIIEEIKRASEKKLREDKTDIGVGVKKNQQVKVRLTSPTAVIDENEMTLPWTGQIREFSFMYFVPDNVQGKTLPMTANIYVDDVIATRLQILVPLERIGTPITFTRQDVKEAFMSYSSKDRTQVLTFAQGLSRARPDLKIFLDVKSLRSGQDWQEKLAEKIDNCQVLYLCWSRNAKASEIVDYEWRHAYTTKGAEAIEPVPLEPPQLCAPPRELSNLHFNDLYMLLGLAEKKVQELMQENP